MLESKNLQKNNHMNNGNKLLYYRNFYFSQIGTGIPLRGHSGPIQAVSILSKEEVVLSASHDSSMRAWRLSDYSCASIYRYIFFLS